MLGIIIVNYKSEKLTASFVKNEISKVSTPNKIVIVNNSCSSEDKVFFHKELNAIDVEETMTEINSDIFLITPTKNLGFAKANNMGAAFLNTHFNIDYLLFTNNDIVLSDKNVVEHLISIAETDKIIGGIGPGVIGKDGRFQSPHQRISFYRYFGWYLLMPLRRKKSLPEKHTSDKTKRNFQTAHYCYWVSGCFMIVKKESFFAAGMFDSKTFLYSEEKILAERFLNIGKRFYFEPQKEVIHSQGAITEKHFKTLDINEMIFRNDCYYYKAYRNVPGILIWILRVIRRFRLKNQYES